MHSWHKYPNFYFGCCTCESRFVLSQCLHILLNWKNTRRITLWIPTKGVYQIIKGKCGWHETFTATLFFYVVVRRSRCRSRCCVATSSLFFLRKRGDGGFKYSFPVVILSWQQRRQDGGIQHAWCSWLVPSDSARLLRKSQSLWWSAWLLLFNTSLNREVNLTYCLSRGTQKLASWYA